MLWHEIYGQGEPLVLLPGGVDAARRRDLFAWLGDAARSVRQAAVVRAYHGKCTDRGNAVALWMVTERLPRLDPRFLHGD